MCGNIIIIAFYGVQINQHPEENLTMRLATANDIVFDKLLTDNDKIIFNLFELIKQNSRAFIATDDETYIFAESSRRAPSWLYLSGLPQGKSLEELVSLVSGMVKLNALFKINARDELVRPLLDAVSEECRVPYSPELEMEVYSCNAPHPFERLDGRMISPREEHRELMKEFVVGMVRDSAGLSFDTDETEKFTSALLSSQSFFLWENSDGKIVSMAKIAHKANGFARLNAIFTDTDQRGRDYTKMLLSQITVSLLEEGFIPLIYSDRLIVDKNKAFEAIGYKKVGDITQFAFHH